MCVWVCVRVSVYLCVYPNNLIAQSHIAVSLSKTFTYSFFASLLNFDFCLCPAPCPALPLPSQAASLAVHFLHRARQAIIVNASALGTPDRVRPSIRLTLKPQKYVLQRSIVDLVLLQQLLFPHRMRFALQLIDDGILQGECASCRQLIDNVHWKQKRRVRY